MASAGASGTVTVEDQRLYIKIETLRGRNSAEIHSALREVCGEQTVDRSAVCGEQTVDRSTVCGEQTVDRSTVCGEQTVDRSTVTQTIRGLNKSSTLNGIANLPKRWDAVIEKQRDYIGL